MRYWMLTVVLLAFWLGRETGAKRKDADPVKFDKIEVKEIVLVDGRLRTRISPGWVRIYGERTSTLIRPGAVSLRAAMTTEGESNLMIAATEFGAGIDVKCSPRNAASIHAWKKGAVVGVGDGASGRIHSRSGGAQLIFSPSIGPAVEVFDEAGGVRAVLGSVKTGTNVAGAALKSPTSNLTLYDKGGKLLVQLPDKK